jgi:hypothetical protein
MSGCLKHRRRDSSYGKFLFCALLASPMALPSLARAASDSSAASGGGTVTVDSGIGAVNALAPPAPGALGSCVPVQPLATLGSDSQPAPALSKFLQPSVSLAEVYSDNFELVPDSAARSNYATVLRPGLSGCSVGSRLYTTFDYSAQLIRYARNPPKDQVYNQFKGALKADLYGNHLFLDANGKYGQSVIDPMAVYSTNNVFSTTSNRANVWTSSVSPYWKQSLGRLGLATLRYSYGRVVYTNTSLNGSKNWTKSFHLVSPSSNVDWSWTLDWKSTRVKYDDTGKTDYFDNASLRLGYQLFYNVKLLATGGVENDYKPDGTVDRYGSHFWNAGFQWANPFSSLQVLYGHRFFGHSWAVNAGYHARALQLRMGYTETPTVSSLQQVEAATAPAVTAGPVTPLNQLQNTSLYIDKRWTTNVTYLMSRSRLNVGLFDDRKYYRPESLGEDRTSGGSVGWFWQATARTRVNASFNRERLVSRLTPDSTDLMNTASLGATYALLTNTELSFILNRQTRHSYIEANNYTANSALLQLSATF